MNTNENSPKANPRLKRIQIVSGIFRTIFFTITLMCILGGLAVVFPIFFISGPAKVGLIASTASQWFFAIFAWACYKLFAQFSSGDLFTARIVSSIRRVGYAFLLTSLAAGICQTISLHALKSIPHSSTATAANPDWALAVFTFAGSILLPAFLIIFIAWVMDEGRKIREEQELTV
jgi:hypothetical protein